MKKKEKLSEKDTLENDDTINKAAKTPLLILLKLKRVLTDNGRFWYQTLCPIDIFFIFRHKDISLMRDRPARPVEFFKNNKNKNVTHTAMYKGNGPA